MKTTPIPILLFISLALAGQLPAATPGKGIREYPLDHHTVIRLPVPYDGGNTTLMFPSALSGIYGSVTTRDAGKPADFLLTFKDGNYYFQVRALHPGVKDVLTVIHNRVAYIIQIEASDTPVYSATFTEPRSRFEQVRPVVPVQLLGLIDKAKSYGLLAKYHPEAVSNIEYARPARVMFYPNFRVYLDEVFRFDQEDTVVFRILLENLSTEPIVYDKDKIAVRISDRIYSISAVDASGVIPPGVPVPVYFSITGTPRGGGRNNLPANSPWNVLVPVIEAATPVISASPDPATSAPSS